MKKLSFEKIFCIISFLFLTSCIIFFGTRFIKLYFENKKVEDIEKNTLVKSIKEANNENELFKLINEDYYFTKEADNNYVYYSNILWRIIKINSDNSITLISNNSLSYLAFGTHDKIDKSPIYNWLNKNDEDYSGILEKNLNSPDKYLQKNISCTDILDEATNNPCKDTNTDSYISLLSIIDYLNAGSKDSFIANKEYFYLNNTNESQKAWYINDSGKPSLSSGNDILGIRPVITVKSNIDYISGNGKKDDPYIIEEENSLFGSYVKLDNQIWRIYQVNDNNIRLMLNDYLKTNDTNLEYIYSNSSSYHNDTAYGSIAHYLNTTFLNSLSYKDKIIETTWSNGYYSSTNDYDYKSSLTTTIDSKVALLSIGDIFLNSELSNYFTMTGTSDKGYMTYIIPQDKKIYAKQVSSKAYIVPVISLDKELLTKGKGTIDSPYEME